MDDRVTIRTANADDAQAVRMLLPTAAHALAHCLVAESGTPPRIVGTAALTTGQRQQPLAGPGIALHTIEPFRGRGIAKELLRCLVEQATRRGAMALYATQRVPLESAEMHAWQSLGFVPCETVQHHELPLVEFEPQLAPLYERLRQRGKIPDTAQIIPLYEANAPEVIQLHLACMGGDAVSLGQRIRGEVPESFAAKHSRVLLLDDRVVGCILGHRTAPNVVHVDANIIDPSIRGRWANVWLKLEATRGALRWGIDQFVFTTFDHYTDTRSFTTRMTGTTVTTMVLMYLPLATH